MVKAPLIAVAAALSVGLFATAPASATVTAGGPLPMLSSAPNVQLADWNGHPQRRLIRPGSNHQSFRRGDDSWRHRNRHDWDHRRHYGWGGDGFGFGVAPVVVGGYGYDGGYNDGYAPDDGYGYDAGGYGNEGDGHVQYCMDRYRSYDPNTDTFVGYDGMRHRCNAY